MSPIESRTRKTSPRAFKVETRATVQLAALRSPLVQQASGARSTEEQSAKVEQSRSIARRARGRGGRRRAEGARAGARISGGLSGLWLSRCNFLLRGRANPDSPGGRRPRGLRGSRAGAWAAAQLAPRGPISCRARVDATDNRQVSGRAAGRAQEVSGS